MEDNLKQPLASPGLRGTREPLQTHCALFNAWQAISGSQFLAGNWLPNV